jgi:iron complex transport system substrate-binding protein
MKLDAFPAVLLLFALAAFAGNGRAEVSVTDDLGHAVRLERPAKRIVSLSPHVTEQLFAAGAGSRIVGAVEYSDYPPEAKRIPRVGDSRAIDMERLLAMKPDLIVVWFYGNAQKQIDLLLTLGIPVYYNEPRKVDDVASSLERLGKLAGTEAVAYAAARTYRERVRALRERYGGREPVSVFYEIWNRPLYTVNGKHLIGDVIRLCGGRNVFADLPALAPVVTQEAVLKANPDAIVASGMGGVRPEWLVEWKSWPDLTAAKLDNLFAIESDLINRHGPRIAEGARRLCEMLDAARSRKKR